jgi:hypothetical protein
VDKHWFNLSVNGKEEMKKLFCVFCLLLALPACLVDDGGSEPLRSTFQDGVNTFAEHYRNVSGTESAQLVKFSFIVTVVIDNSGPNGQTQFVSQENWPKGDDIQAGFIVNFHGKETSNGMGIWINPLIAGFEMENCMKWSNSYVADPELWRSLP